MTTDLELVLMHYGMEFVPEGRNRPCRCPFHDDAHASASVDTDKGLFNCHTCDAHGDAYSLVMLKEGCSFVDAKRIVSELLGGSDGELRGEPRREGSYLPSRSGDRRDRRAYRPSWLSRQSRNGA